MLPIRPLCERTRSIGMFRSGTTTLGSDTIDRTSVRSIKRVLVKERTEQNMYAKVGVLDSSHRTALNNPSGDYTRTHIATMNKNDVKHSILVVKLNNKLIIQISTEKESTSSF